VFFFSLPKQQALTHPWLTGDSATDHNLLPELKAYLTRARLRRGIEMVKLANRIEALKMQDDDPDEEDLPKDATLAADQSRARTNSIPSSTSSASAAAPPPAEKRTLSKTIKGAIFREVVLAKVREMKQKEETLKVTEEVEKEARRKSFHAE
jgi:calcium/calmodulin-dependent protein kinase I